MPTLSLTSTHAVVSRGENIQFRCTTPKPRCNANAEFQLFRNGLSVSSQTHVSSTFHIKAATAVNTPTKTTSSHLIATLLTSLWVSVFSLLSLPTSGLLNSGLAPDGQFVVGSQGPVITRGHSFTIVCSTESPITRSESAVNHSSSFSFPEADYSHEGTYSCVYEVSVSSRSFRSSASKLLLITIT
ncbi:hypothetical protein M9458_055745, partial [Cirrhinus mrigala]